MLKPASVQSASKRAGNILVTQNLDGMLVQSNRAPSNLTGPDTGDQPADKRMVKDQ